ncbi:hypothetical protein K7X08_005903 [Anisodus acutangulus]|uniref:Uncharacterized protein n=1 Tax=Anisodus acutangulus TaxID=402998 RepID=A0A9Q1R8M4_9SOLA|nr:hypothetical protein K7X08_005903 [Anisodus acutangulus]
MDEHGGGSKVTGIRQIVRLKELLHKWQNVTLSPKGTNEHPFQSSNMNSNGNNFHGGISPAITKRLKSTNVCCDSDDESCQSPEPPHGVPKEKVEEEFGFDHTGGLTIPCEIETFKYLLQCMENHQRDHGAHDPQHDSAGSSLAIEG